MTAEQRHALIDELIKLQPEKSNRAIGKQAGVHHETIGGRRVKLQEKGDVAESATRTDSRGRKQRASRRSHASSKRAIAVRGAREQSRRKQKSAEIAEFMCEREAAGDRLLALVIEKLDLDDDKLATFYTAMYWWTADIMDAIARKLRPEVRERAERDGGEFDEARDHGKPPITAPAPAEGNDIDQVKAGKERMSPHAFRH